MKYSELIKQKAKSQLQYQDLLNCDEWQNRRDEILTTKGEYCQNCGTGGTIKLIDKSIYSIQIFQVYETIDSEKIEIPNEVPLFESCDEINPLHIHHEYYIENELPWKYPNDALTVLCSKCHRSFHNKNQVIVYSDWTKKDEIETTTCLKCDGTGFIAMYHYFHEGVCFMCKGKGFHI